jgi:hypothetical protein
VDADNQGVTMRVGLAGALLSLVLVFGAADAAAAMAPQSVAVVQVAHQTAPQLTTAQGAPQLAPAYADRYRARHYRRRRSFVGTVFSGFFGLVGLLIAVGILLVLWISLRRSRRR